MYRVNQLQGYKKLSEAKNELVDSIKYFSNVNVSHSIAAFWSFLNHTHIDGV